METELASVLLDTLELWSTSLELLLGAHLVSMVITLKQEMEMNVTRVNVVLLNTLELHLTALARMVTTDP